MWRNFTNDPQGKATARLRAVPAELRMMSVMAVAAAHRLCPPCRGFHMLRKNERCFSRRAT